MVRGAQSTNWREKNVIFTLYFHGFCRCDRILWYGEGIRQAYYIRGESRFSDHRPVCAEFLIDVAVEGGGLRRGMSGPHMKIGPEELLPTMVRYGRERTM